MRNKLHYALDVQRDMDEIWDHIAEERQNVGAASALIDSILDDIEQLADFPELGPPLSSIADVESDYRFLVTGNYLTFYRVYGTDIYIDRVMYGRRDYLRVLLGAQEED